MPKKMILTTNFLKEHHRYWSNKLVELKIFNNELNEIQMEIKYNVKSFNGMFRVRSGLEKIILYPPTKDIALEWVDNVLVHEMIHQYIYENSLHDSSSHGPIFRRFMNIINRANIGVTISVSTKIERFVDSSKNISSEVHKILVLKFADIFYLCKIKSTKINYFTELILTHKMNWKKPLVGFGWYKTRHTKFDNYQSCNSRLHGIVYRNDEWNQVFKDLALTKMEVISEL